MEYLLKKVNRLNKSVQDDIGSGKIFEKVKIKFVQLQKARKELEQVQQKHSV